MSQYPIQAEQPIIDAFNERSDWITVSPTAIATAALTALMEAGWSIAAPRSMPGVCSRCRTFIAEGTTHRPFNGNQMFACAIESVGAASPTTEAGP